MLKKNLKIKRIAIVGFGSIGKRHLRVIKKINPKLEIIIVRYINNSFAKEQKFAKAIVSSIEEAIKFKLDAAIISSPSPFHICQASKFLLKKIPILIEKPLSNNKKGIEKFRILAKKKKTLILIGYVLRYSSSLGFFYKLIKKNIAGEPIFAKIRCLSYLPNWRPDQDYRNSISAIESLGGGVLPELSHELNYANWIFGPFKNVSAKLRKTKKLNIDVEDKATLKFFSFKGYNISVNLSFSNNKNFRDCIFKGSKGILSWNGIKNSVSWKPNSGKNKNWFFKNKKNEIYKKQMKHFFHCIEKKIIPQVPLDDCIQTLDLIINSQRSNKKKKLINIKKN